jgi:hypothetical protein
MTPMKLQKRIVVYRRESLPMSSRSAASRAPPPGQEAPPEPSGDAPTLALDEHPPKEAAAIAELGEEEVVVASPSRCLPTPTEH